MKVKVWTVTCSEANESLDCEVFETEQKALVGYLTAMGLGDDDEQWDRLVALYWSDASAFDEWICDYLEENYPSNMYRLYDHEIELPEPRRGISAMEERQHRYHNR